MVTFPKATVLPILEYCSQLWNPVKVGQIRAVKSIQRHFTSKIYGIQHLSYWDRLRNLDLYSIERRRERYIVLYVYKIILVLSPNFEDDRLRIKTVYNERRGLSCVLPSVTTSATGRIKTAVEQFFVVRGPMLFNSLPRDIRSNKLGYERFKTRLDEILSKVDDNPSFPNLRPRAVSNSLLDQLELMKRDGSYSQL